MKTEPRHPVVRLGGTIGRLPRYVRLANALLHDPDVSKPRKAALAAGMAYLASPIDLVPGIIPVAGQLDDLAAVLYAIRTALRGLPADQGRRHLIDVGLAPTALAADITIVREATGWTVRTIATVGKSFVSLSIRAARAAVWIGGGLRASLSLRRKPRRDVDRG